VHCSILLSFYKFHAEGDDLKTDDPKKAIEMFERVVQMETELGDQVKWYVSIKFDHPLTFLT
jgi:hypothetical protein